MILEVSEKDKIAYYWLSKEEKANTEFRDSLRPGFGKWKEKGYKVCVFLSGEGDLFENTKELLLHNREVLALQRVRGRGEKEQR